MTSDVRDDGVATEYREIDRWDGGIGWIAHPDERMQRASHALAVDGDVYLVDPLDAPGLDDLVSAFGDVAGVVVLLGRHERDAALLARRYDVPVYLPPGVDRAFTRPVRRLDGELADTGYRVLNVVDWPMWREVALYDGETLIVPEAVGTASYFLVGGETLGVNPALRATPPASLRTLDPARVLVGHGAGVFEDAGRTLSRAISTARTNLPRAWFRAIRERSRSGGGSGPDCRSLVLEAV